MGKVLVTGSSGFVGRELIHSLLQRDISVVAHSRKYTIPGCLNIHAELSADTNWMNALKCVDTVIHCAARVHQMTEPVEEAQRAYRVTNVDATLNLAKQAAEAGVKRFIFISSIKVNGEWTKEEHPFLYSDQPNPQDEYGVSKYEAERQIQELCRASDMDFVIIRPPLVYGPGVKANFLSMMNWVNKGFPLPLGKIDSKRSLVYVKNLVELVILSMNHPAAANQVFLVSDDDDVSIAVLLKAIANSMGKRSCLLPVPQLLLSMMLTLFRKKSIAQRLCMPLQLDINHTKSLLNWTPSYSLKEGIDETVQDYLKQKG